MAYCNFLPGYVMEAPVNAKRWQPLFFQCVSFLPVGFPASFSSEIQNINACVDRKFTQLLVFIHEKIH